MPIEWPVYFDQDDSDMWRKQPTYEQRMAMLAWVAVLNYNLIKED